MATDYHQLLSLLHLSPSHRPPEVLQQISQTVTQLKFFKELSEEALTACCKVMRGQLFRRHQIVFSFGDQGSSFYVILHGTVRVLVPLHPTGANRGLAYRKLTSDVNDEGKLQLREVALLREGEGFGELALLQSENRTATIECKGLVFLAKIFREDYNRVLRLQQEKKLINQIRFLKATAAFSGFGEMQLAKLVYFFHERHYIRNSVVYRKGDPSVSIYIVASGEFVFSDTRTIYVNINPEEGVIVARSKQIQLYSKGTHEMFGEEEIFRSQERQMTCTCASVNGVVYYMSKEEFLKWCQSEGTQKYLGRYRDSKSAWLEQRVPSILKGESAKLSMSFTSLKKTKLSSPVAEKDKLKRLLVTTGTVGRLKREEESQQARVKSRGLPRSKSSMQTRSSMYINEK